MVTCLPAGGDGSRAVGGIGGDDDRAATSTGCKLQGESPKEAASIPTTTNTGGNGCNGGGSYKQGAVAEGNGGTGMHTYQSFPTGFRGNVPQSGLQ